MNKKMVIRVHKKAVKDCADILPGSKILTTNWQPRFLAYCKYYGLTPEHKDFKGENFLIFIFNQSADFKKSIGKNTGEPLSVKEHKDFTKYLQNLKPITPKMDK